MAILLQLGIDVSNRNKPLWIKTQVAAACHDYLTSQKHAQTAFDLTPAHFLSIKRNIENYFSLTA
jgi:hypothetical protein